MSAALPFEEHRPALVGHCYRMLGSVVDAEDAVQEAMVRAWTGWDGFDGRASVRTWLYRIATHVCLDALAATKRRRVRPPDAAGPPGTVGPGLTLTTRPREWWVEPVPDAAVLPADGDPEERAVLRESVRTAFVAALQCLPARGRAVLLLREVLGFSAAETAESLGLSVAAVNSALQRARATLAARSPDARPSRALPEAQAALAARYAEAFERYDVPALTALLHEDAVLSMPPFELWLRGHAPIAAWMLGPGAGCRGSRLVPVAACGGAAAFAQYRDGGATPWALLVLEVGGGPPGGARITSTTAYLDVETLFPRFGLPMQVAPDAAQTAP